MKVKFDPTINIGSVLTISGGVLTVIITAATAYVQLGALREQQHAMAEKVGVVSDRQGAITVSISRIEGRLDVLMERRRADLGSVKAAGVNIP